MGNILNSLYKNLGFLAPYRRDHLDELEELTKPRNLFSDDESDNDSVTTMLELETDQSSFLYGDQKID